ncbi:MAG: type II toxin-antitoxin system RelE/ParE family toxin [Mucilaginibacter sp.]|nr:type II toxin-antitoxin system RelE/ParE family toxin [Mucilaginibacter sp.]
MRYDIITTTNARLDIQDAIDWEDKRNAGLGKRLFTELDQKINKLATSPYIGSVRYDNVRCIVTEVFSYLIHYLVDDVNKQILILRVLHTSRRPIW